MRNTHAEAALRYSRRKDTLHWRGIPSGRPYACRGRPAHLRLVGNDVGRRPTLEDVLQRLLVLGGDERFAIIPPGRELSVLSRVDVVSELSRVVEVTPEPGSEIEAFLDRIFMDYAPGADFAHEVAVAMVLIAVSKAEAVAAQAYFASLASLFAESKSAELGLVRRVARALLARKSGAGTSTTR